MQVEHFDFIGVYRNAFSTAYCEEAIAKFEQADAEGFTNNRQDFEAFNKTEKNDQHLMPYQVLNSQLFGDLHGEFFDVFWNDAYRLYNKEWDILNNADNHKIYFNKVQRTVPGQGYHVWHFESSTRDTSNRLLAYILYLNDVEEGGETEFLYQAKRVKPEAGTLVIFPASFTHAHRGNPPLSGSKYIMTGWVEY